MKKLLLPALFLMGSAMTYGQWTQSLSTMPSPAMQLASDGTSLFAATDGDGMYKSTNNGLSWTSVNAGLPSSMLIEAVHISGSNVFAGTMGGGIYKSTNAGSTWSPANTGGGTLSFTDVFAFITQGSDLFAGAQDGIYKSTNAGGSWTYLLSAYGSRTTGSFASIGSNLFAGASNPGDPGLFLSTDAGSSWTNASTGMASQLVTALATRGTSLYAGTVSTDGGVFVSTDNGTTWTQLNDMFNGLTNTNVHSLAIEGTDIFAGTEDGVFMSRDLGVSWVAVNTGFIVNPTVNDLCVSDGILFAATDEGGSEGVWKRSISDIIAVADAAAPDPFKVYPSPTTGRCTLQCQWKASHALQATLYSSNGTKVLDIQDIDLTQPKELDFSGLPPGIYLLQVQAEDEVHTKKIVLTR